jgi:predicted DNA-binding protein (MmcQ/YjbR family)
MPDANPNPFFQALYEHCAAKPQAMEDHPWGETVFKIGGKVFAFLGQPDHGGVTVKAATDELDGLLTLSFIKRSPYIGRYGWIRVSVENDDALDLALRLIDHCYETIAAKAPGKKRGTKKNEAPPSKKAKEPGRSKKSR